jgi:hypothetical protein
MTRKLGIAFTAVIAIAIWIARSGSGSAPPSSAARGELGRRAQVAATPGRSAAIRGGVPSTSDVAGGMRLEGQVVGHDGSGAGGAKVVLSTTPPTEIVAEADGSFAFERLASRTYAVTAIAGALIGGPVIVQLASASEPVVVRLAPGAALAVHVVDDRGKPVAPAIVALVDTTARTIATDDAGVAVIRPLRAGPVAILVSAAGYATTEAIAAASPGGTEITIALHEGYPVSGRVIDERGEPIAGAEISVARASAGAGAGGARVETSATGGFTVAALAAGTHTLQARDDEHAPAASPPITVADRAITGVEITMTAGAVVAGVVVATDRSPVPSGTVRLVGRGSGTTVVRETSTDAQGRFEVRGLPRATMHAQAESGRATASARELDLAAHPILRDVELVLDATGAISGVVVDPDGTPMSEVQITAYPTTEDVSASGRAAPVASSSITTDGTGGFALRGLRTGAYRLFVTGELFGLRNAAQGVSAATGDDRVRIALVAAGRLRGMVRCARTGRAPARGSVQLAGLLPVPVHDGRFETMDLTPGRFEAVFRADGCAELKRDVAIEAGKTTDLGTIDLSGGRTVVGRVVDERGAPVVQARVQTADSVAITDRDGRFAISGVPSVPTSLAADHATRGRSIAQSISEGFDDPPPVTLVLRGVGSITGVVTMANRPQEGAMITAVAKDGAPQPMIATADSDGSFALTDAPAGEYVVTAVRAVSATSVATTSATIAVTAGGRSRIALELRR